LTVGLPVIVALPEPTSAALLGITALGLLARRKARLRLPEIG